MSARSSRRCRSDARSRRRRRARGSAYLAIVGATLLVAAIGFAAVSAARVQLRGAERDGDVQAARGLAHSGVQLARLWMAQRLDWRTTRPSGLWLDRLPMEGGTLTIEVRDPVDDNLSNWETDPVVVTATVSVGVATQVERVTLVPQRNPLGCLDVAAFVNGSSNINSGTLTCDQTVATNADFATSGSSRVDCSVEAAGTITGSGYLGSRAAGVLPRAAPDAQSIFDAYVVNATTISYASTSGKIDRRLLSPARNPFGAQTNPLGIYVIDCRGNSLEIKDSRIVGTLVLLNVKSDARIRDQVLMEPAVPGFPVLLVQGTMNYELKAGELRESDVGNLNPPGTPYNGASDTDAADRYPCMIKGLIFQSGDLNNTAHLPINGQVVVNGTLTNSGTITLSYDPASRANVPPGFAASSAMTPQSGSYRRVVR